MTNSLTLFDHLEDSGDLKTKIIYVRDMIDGIYGSKSPFKHCDKTIKVWAGVIRPYSQKQLKKALEALYPKHAEFAPTAFEFLGLCKAVANREREDQILQELRDNSTKFDNENYFVSPKIRKAIKECDAILARKKMGA